MNVVILMGRLVDEPDYSTYGKKKIEEKGVARFTLAVNRPGKDNGADFIRCVAFAGTANFCRDYLDKGQRVLVKGHWQTGTYEDKDGNARYSNDCICDSIEFADSKKDK